MAMSHNACAAIWGAVSLVPKECVELWNTFTNGKGLDKAREQWKFLWEVSDFLENVNHPAGIKAGLDIIGQSSGPVRLPSLPLEKEEVSRFSRIHEKRRHK
ncbi:unnamed protein product [Debaryomyces tyrocola]|nr:unnamed protein product [Debaryomyces tyrocola]